MTDKLTQIKNQVTTLGIQVAKMFDIDDHDDYQFLGVFENQFNIRGNKLTVKTKSVTRVGGVVQKTPIIKRVDKDGFVCVVLDSPAQVLPLIVVFYADMEG